MYDAANRFYCAMKDINLSDVVPFSSMEDKNGYNECTSDLHTDYIINVFKDFVERYKDSISNIVADRPPCEVVSIDHTYINTWKTKTYLNVY